MGKHAETISPPKPKVKAYHAALLGYPICYLQEQVELVPVRPSHQKMEPAEEQEQEQEQVQRPILVVEQVDLE
jgi:hypothetical protein